MHSFLGDRTSADDEKPVKKKKEKPAKVEDKANAVDSIPAQTPEDDINPFSIFPQPEENFKVHTEICFSDGKIWKPHNAKENLEKHFKVTNGKALLGSLQSRMGICILVMQRLCSWTLACQKTETVVAI